MISVLIPFAALALVAVAAAASNSGWVPYQDRVIRWAIGEDAIVANAEVNRHGALLTLRYGQPAMIYGSTVHDPELLIRVVNRDVRSGRIFVGDCRMAFSVEFAGRASS